MYELLWLVVAGLALGLFIAFDRLTTVKSRLRRLEQLIDDIQDRGRAAAAAPAAPATPRPEPAPKPAAAPGDVGAGAPPPVYREPRPAAPAAPPAPKRRMSEELERQITERWMIWLGGITLALGGAFLVKFSIDQGLLGPTMRIALGLATALVMIGIGEWLRRRGSAPAFLEGAPDYIPGGITAAGVFTAYATIFAAFQLYDMMVPLAAFVLLASISFAGLMLAIVHGPFLALLGLSGAYVIPILVSTGKNDAASLFFYLFVVTAGGMEVFRYFDWRRTALVGLAFSAAWIIVWTVALGNSGDGFVIGLFGLGLAALHFFRLYPVRAGADAIAAAEAPWYNLAALPYWSQFALGGGAIALFAQLAGSELSGLTPALYGTMLVLILLTGVSAVRAANLDALVALVAIGAVLQLGSWSADYADHTTYSTIGYTPFIPSEYRELVTLAAGYAALFLCGASFALRRVMRPGFWTSIAVITPLALVAYVFGTIHHFTPSPGWGAVALGLAGIYALLASRADAIAAGQSRAGRDAVLATYAVGTTAAIALGFAMSLENAWLTVALAAQLPAIAWVWRKLEVPGLKTTALVLAAIILARCAFNPYILDYHISGYIPGLNWILYGYGLPAAAFYLARHLFALGKDDGSKSRSRLLDVLEAGALVFAFLLLSLEIRSILSSSGSIYDRYDLAEQGLQTINMMGFSLVLLRLEGRRRRPFYKWFRIALTVMTAGNLLLFEGILGPWLQYDNVGDWPILNALLLAYAIPGVLAVLIHRAAGQIGARYTATLYGGAALVLFFAWINYSVRQAFHGGVLAMGLVSDAENYSYSIAWLAYAGALLGVGLWRKDKVLRYASLAVLLITVGKVFIFDLEKLEGLWRALSFLGLGAALMGIGLLYRRFVFPHPAHTRDEAGD